VRMTTGCSASGRASRFLLRLFFFSFFVAIRQVINLVHWALPPPLSPVVSELAPPGSRWRPYPQLMFSFMLPLRRSGGSVSGQCRGSAAA
jgi:hypothetical protein